MGPNRTLNRNIGLFNLNLLPGCLISNFHTRRSRIVARATAKPFMISRGALGAALVCSASCFLGPSLPASASRITLTRNRAVWWAPCRVSSLLAAATDAGFPVRRAHDGNKKSSVRQSTQKHRVFFKGKEVMADDGETLRTGIYL